MQASLSPRDFPQTSTDRRVRRPRRTAPGALVLAVLTLLGATGCDGGSLPSESESAAPAPPNCLALVEAASNSWQTRPPMPTGRYGLVAASVNGIVYAIGGWFNGELRTVEAYHPATKTLVAWRPRAPLPAARTWPSGAAVINGKIYVPGGQNAGDAPTKSLFVYNPATDHWATKAAMPVASARGAAGAINGKLYVYTASYDGNSSFLHRYDPGTNTWTKRATPPHRNQLPAAGVIDGKFYLAGGVYAGSVVATLDVYDPATNTWTTRKSMPTPRGYAAGRGLNGKLYVVGGGSGGQPLGRVEAYDPATNTWTTKASMPTARWNLAATSANGILYALGGLGPAGGYTRNEAYTP
jgi:N-acetylneuraminic acid mutarotase